MSNWSRFGRGPRPVIPPEFYRMSEEEMVRRLMEWGASERMARRDAKQFLAYRSGRDPWSAETTE